jgi:signal transduction histidine kinase
LTAHAGARAIALRGELSAAELCLILTHDGPAFDGSPYRNDAQFASLQHRIERLGGRFAIDRAAPGGSTLIAFVPLP